MLNEHERRALNEIERGLCEEDPAVARGFEEGFTRNAWLWPYTAGIVFAAILLVAGIGLELPFTALFAFALTVGAIAGRRHASRRNQGDDAGSESA